MTTPNEELQARHVEVLQAVRTVFKNIPAPCAERDALDYAIAALARQEEGREAVDPERLAQLIAHRACCGTEHDPANGKLHGYCVVCGVDWPCEYAGKPPAPSIAALAPHIGGEGAWLRDLIEEVEAIDCRHHGSPSYDHDAYYMKQRVLELIERRKQFLATPTPQAGEGDAKVARLRQALQDVADPIGYLRREAEAKGERLGGMAYSIANDLHFVKQIASRALATPTPQAADITAIAELREIMADESGEREALLVSFFRTTGAAMGRHGDAMGWTPEQTARHYLSEASK